ncbi:leucine-rich repeat-containing protein 30 [Microplitis demolitor]|uniref:leucine-rich repeat-containing protein 30 n=1 Tax=Microplitis demolitor TaxID=69319 RepID=UPI0006D4CCA4|nr:leucine-rich repeat-containing protein 30 [Microplitis demolitor]
MEELIEEIKNKKILHWNYRGFNELPQVFKNYGHDVREIYLKENKLTCLPPWICDFNNLTNLYLSGNKLNIFPDELCQMKQLLVIDLCDNNIELLPNSIQNLCNLRQLLLDDNYLNQLPSELIKLECLEILSLARNNLISLPEWLGSLKKLDKLIVDNNYLEEIPNRLTLACSLTTISIKSNRLRYLPLNSFISPVNIYFDCNPNVNYLSYSILCQLLELGWEDGKNCLINECKLVMSASKNIKLLVNLCGIKGDKKDIIELPRQLFQVFGEDIKIPVSLWELSLRNLYKNKEDDFFDKYYTLKHDIFYNLLSNGPISICLNSHCREPIFTEAWIVVGKSEECVFLVITLFCSQNCASSFDFPSHGIETLSWDYYDG